MLRVGYPASFDPSLRDLFPSEGVELIALPDLAPETLTEPVELDVWIPPYIDNPRFPDLWKKLTGVKVVLALMAGTDWLTDVIGPGVTICGSQGAPTISTAEWAATATLAMLKYLPQYHDIQKSAQWSRRTEIDSAYTTLHALPTTMGMPVCAEDLYNKQVLIVGHGSIGQRIEQLLTPFGANITRVARSARTEPEVHAITELNTLLPASDIVILILPLTAESRGLINAERIALMKPGTLIVNAARGPVIDTEALVAALNAGHIRAALDVTDPEPLPADHPLWRCPNVLITPHVAGVSADMTRRAMSLAADQVRALLAGKPLINVARQG